MPGQGRERISSGGGGSSASSAVQGASGSASGGGRVTFKLFDFGLSMVNPDRFSMGQQANGTPQEKQEALRSLREQGRFQCVRPGVIAFGGCGVAFLLSLLAFGYLIAIQRLAAQRLSMRGVQHIVAPHELAMSCCRAASPALSLTFVCKFATPAGYVFHKALGMVSLFHTFQFGRAADMYRLCKVSCRLRLWQLSGGLCWAGV